jgi:hypothetical protein
VWKIDDVNESKTLIKKIIPENRRLELAKSFDSIFKDLDTLLDLHQFEEIILDVRGDASFTDTRIIYIWLKSAELFWGTAIEIISEHDVDEIYSSSPRIG